MGSDPRVTASGPFPPGMPPGAASELAGRSAAPVRAWDEGHRSYALAESPEGLLFARWSTDPEDGPVLAHEARVRQLVGASGALRAPEVIAQGPGWMVERGLAGAPPRGPEAIAEVLTAASALAALELPALDGGPGESRGRALVRRARLAASPLSLRDVARSRSLLSSCELPLVTSHGDFHSGNLLWSAGALWVIDWELVGSRPLGFDLLTLWPTLEAEEDRDRLWHGAIAIAGRDRPASWLGCASR